jgi:polysaccharide export outer membrane protein
MRYRVEKNAAKAFFVGFSILLVSGVGYGQEPSAQRANHLPTGAAATVDYTIGPGDLLSVSIVDAPEFGGKFRVSDSGMVDIPGVPNSIHAEGQTPLVLSKAIGQALVDAKQLRNPRVNVFVEEYRGRTITLLGAVAKPSVYPLQKRTNVMEALSLAGGALPNAGSTVTIVRGPASAEATGMPEGSVQIIPMSRLMKGEDLSANVEVRNGDVLSVSAAQVVYVVGAVTKPGGYVMSDPSTGISALQAIALAEGFKSTASTHHALIVRQSTSDNSRKEIPVDLGQIQQGKLTDVELAPNDILYIPNSGTKVTLQAMGRIAEAAVTGIAYYGVGYRLATR